MGKIKNFLEFNKEILDLYKIRNSCILRDERFGIEDNKVNLHYWRFGKTCENIGDYLSSVVVDYMKDYYKVDDNITTETKHLYAIGSILQAGRQNATVWGSGFLDPLTHRTAPLMKYLRKLDIRAVRGPNTRNHLIDLGYKCPESYGDPAVLMPLIYPGKPSQKSKNYILINHFSDDTSCENSLNVLTNDYKNFIDTILKSKLVVSSSLHGIILSEAYGVPAILYLPKGLNNSLFKYEDYYYSTERFDFPIAKSIDEALSISPCKLPDLSNMQNHLINVFPKDLWLN